MELLVLLGARWRWLAALKPAAALPGASDPAASPLAAPAGAPSAAPGRCSAARAASGPQARAAAPAARASPSCLAAQLDSAATPVHGAEQLMQGDSTHGALQRNGASLLHALHCSMAYLRVCCRTWSSCRVKEELALGGNLRRHSHIFLHGARKLLTISNNVAEDKLS